MYPECNEVAFKNSERGQTKIQAFKNALNNEFENYGFHSWYADGNFLKGYYIKFAPILENHVLSCYELLLDFFIQERLNRQLNEQLINEENKIYEAWVKRVDNNFFSKFAQDIQTALSGFSDLIAMAPGLILVGGGAYIVYKLINK